MPRPTPEHCAAEPQPKWHGHPGRDRFTGWKPVPQSLCRHRRVSGRVVPRGRAATACVGPTCAGNPVPKKTDSRDGSPCHRNRRGLRRTCGNSSTGQIIRRGGGLIVAPAGKRCAAGENRKKDVKSDERSRNVYENKGSTYHLSENKATFLHNFHAFYTNKPVFRRVLQKPTAFLPLFEPAE